MYKSYEIHLFIVLILIVDVRVRARFHVLDLLRYVLYSDK
jgi:hypothetical protein